MKGVSFANALKMENVNIALHVDGLLYNYVQVQAYGFN